MNRWFDNLPVIGKYIPGKITLSFLMLIFSALLGLTFKTTDRMICVFATTLSFLGDIALNHKRDHSKQSNSDFIIGGTAFLLAHLYYCIAYYSKIRTYGFKILNFGSLFAVLLLVIITAIFFYKAPSEKKRNKLFTFGIIYLWITGLDYFTIFSYAYSVKFSIQSIVFIGGLMFFASDIIIGLEKFFGIKSKVLRELVWWLYPIGQIIIIAIA